MTSGEVHTSPMESYESFHCKAVMSKTPIHCAQGSAVRLFVDSVIQSAISVGSEPPIRITWLLPLT